MENSYKTILSILKRVRGRLFMKKTFQNLLIGACAAFSIGLVILLISRIVPIYNVYAVWWYIVMLLGLMTLGYSILNIPDYKTAAAAVDMLGLKERVSTALEMEGSSSIYKELLLEDAELKLKELDYKKHISLLPNKKLILIILLLAVSFTAISFIPNPLKEVAKKNHELSVYKKEQLKDLEKAEDSIKENKKLTEEQKKDLMAKLEELKLQVKASENKKDVDKNIEKAVKKLEISKKTELAEDLKKLGQQLEKNPSTKALAQALKEKDMEKLKEQLDKLKNSLASMDDKTKEGLKEALNKAADSVSNQELKENLKSLSSAVSSSNEAAISKSVDNISGALSEGLSEQTMNEAIAQLQGEMQQNSGSEAQGQQAAQGNGGNQGSAQGQGSGQGQAGGQGQGSGQGQGQPGGGAGSGSSNGDGGITGYNGGVGSKAPGSGESKEYEKIFTPNRIGGTGETTNLSGKSNSNSGNSESTISNDPNASLGELKPYNQVSGEYTQRAMESLDSYEIPDAMMEIIKDYFSSLQQ